MAPYIGFIDLTIHNNLAQQWPLSVRQMLFHAIMVPMREPPDKKGRTRWRTVRHAMNHVSSASSRALLPDAREVGR